MPIPQASRLSLHVVPDGPAFRNTVFTSRPAVPIFRSIAVRRPDVHAGRLDKRPGRCDPDQPISCTAICTDIRCKTFDNTEIAAAIEHGLIAPFRQCGSRQVRCNGQIRAAGKHGMTAPFCQYSGRQCRGGKQTRSFAEHTLIAGHCQCSGRQFRRCGQTRTAHEHGTIAHFCQYCSRQFRRDGQSRAIIEHV